MAQDCHFYCVAVHQVTLGITTKEFYWTETAAKCAVVLIAEDTLQMNSVTVVYNYMFMCVAAIFECLRIIVLFCYWSSVFTLFLNCLHNISTAVELWGCVYLLLPWLIVWLLFFSSVHIWDTVCRLWRTALLFFSSVHSWDTVRRLWRTALLFFSSVHIWDTVRRLWRTALLFFSSVHSWDTVRRLWRTALLFLLHCKCISDGHVVRSRLSCWLVARTSSAHGWWPRWWWWLVIWTLSVSLSLCPSICTFVVCLSVCVMPCCFFLLVFAFFSQNIYADFTVFYHPLFAYCIYIFKIHNYL